MMRNKRKELQLAYSYLEGERVEITHLGVKLTATFMGKEAQYIRVYDGHWSLSKKPTPEHILISSISKIVKLS